MPVVVRTRAYDSQFYKELGCCDWGDETDEVVFAAAEIAKADLGF